MQSKELAKIRSAIDRADQLYYIEGETQSDLNDDEYEALKTRLRQLDPDDSRLSRVGSPYSASDLRDKEDHNIPMGSLDNTDGGIRGFRKWYDSLCDSLGEEAVDLVVSLKLDGNSAGADYKDGMLTRVLSRGNGVVGDNITANGVRWIGMPTAVAAPDLTVRGEVMLYTDAFDKLNSDGEHANPRNLCNGIVGRSSGADNEVLNFRAFNAHGMDFKTLKQKYNLLDAMGFNVVEHIVCEGTRDEVAAGVEKFHNIFEAKEYGGEGKREALPYEIDGLVVVVNNVALQHKLETDDRSKLRPKHSRAIKFVTLKGTTTVKGCTITVGHTGALIPTASLEPVQIGGVTVSSALLNNWNAESTAPSAAHVAVGDTVEVELAGDVIPKIVQIVTKPDDRKPIEEPKEWEGQPTTRVHRGKLTVVTYAVMEDDSPTITKQKIKHYIGTSKKGVGILGVGDGVLTALTESRGEEEPLVTEPADLYALTKEQLVDLSIGTNASGGAIRFGKSRTTALLAEIDKARTLPLHKFLGSLGIDLLGRRKVQILSDQYNLHTLEDWLDENQLARISGDVTRKAIVDGLRKARPAIDKLLKAGVIISDTAPVAGSAGKEVKATAEASEAPESGEPKEASPVAGKSFCFTGTRKYLEQVEALGGIIKSGVSGSCDYLVQKDATSKTNKSRKADELGVIVIGLDCLEAVLAGSRELPLGAPEPV